ncbi:hypothetical protein OMW55_01020 [Sphingomonas sp. BN140010]|uniref:Rap1a immunity protein domain-containing protein n=1 Tax=Sphingomonas arvum TaxID=2992113 RepID=A0ABT3JBH1_9SPHN|nr:hypothetical protein [Sphingomonas sp. BN140010]MCW3796392.1 hypothetical protein [Sphingomonas sp. BN140010]
MPMRLAAVAALLVAAPVAAQSMNAEAFHKRASALQAKGPLAIFSRTEINTLMGEVKASAQKAREQRLATIKAGGKPRYCPPGNSGGIGATEFMQRMAAIPVAERARMDMTEATVRVLASKYPCPA